MILLSNDQNIPVLCDLRIQLYSYESDSLALWNVPVSENVSND